MEFRVSTWNCFGMAQSTLQALWKENAHASERFSHEHVVDECASADVLCVQELMSGVAERFFDALPRFAALHRDHNRFHWSTITVRGTGLGIGSRSAPLSRGVHHFARPAAGWDRFARKGALYACVPLPEERGAVDVVTVHLQAGDEPRAREVRAQQLAHVRDLIARSGDDDRPFVITGDFNIQGLAEHKGAEYTQLRSLLDGFEDLGAEHDLPTFEPEVNPFARAFHSDGVPLRIDYVFFRPAKARPSRLRFERATRFFERPLRRDGAAGEPLYASDHYGLTAVFSLGD